MALELARKHGDEYDHVSFISLGSARTLGAALAALGGALEIDLPPLPERALPDSIAGEVSRFGRTLLILDNFEQLVDSAAVLIDRILERAPSAHLVVTSRARLRLTGEWLCELRGLAEESDALGLLIDRVERLRGEYQPTEVERGQLRAIAQYLEGIPLALEVAAVRISALGTANVAARLGEPLQDDLRRAVARSWDLLTEAEREVLAACSIFRGGFELAAATSVLPAPGLLDDLTELCEKSLLATAPRDDGGQRFHLYESIREFAAEQLDPERTRALARRHAQYFVEVGERLQTAAEGRDAEEILDSLTREHGNLMAAAERGLAGDGVTPELGLRALMALVPLALARGPIAPLLDKIEVALGSEVEPHLRIAVHLAAGRCHRRLGRAELSRHHQKEAVALATSLRDDRLIARVTSDAAMTQLSEGELEGSLAMLSEAVVIRERVRDLEGAALDRLRMGMALRELGRTDRAEEMLAAAMEIFRREGNAVYLGLAFGELVHLALDRGQYEDARRLLSHARRSGAQAASRLTDAALTARTGMLAHAEGDLALAETGLSAAIIGLRRVGYRRFEAGVIGYLGAVDFEAGRLEIAHERLVLARDMVPNDARATEIMSGWICALEVARGDTSAARRAAARIGPLRASDPLSMATHVLAASLTHVAPELSEDHRSHDVRLAYRIGLADHSADCVHAARSGALRVAASGQWFMLPTGVRGECNRYRALRLVLLELVKQRLLHPNGPASRDALIAAGWPGERIVPSAARNRLKVAIASLRRIGLEGLLLRSEGGYLLDPAVPIVVMGDE